MNLQSQKLVYFSPTGTTKTIVKSISAGIGLLCTEIIDITDPEVRKRSLNTAEDELLIVGVPVYMGRIPALITDWLSAINATNTPVVCVVAYGNRAYEDALLELKNILTSCGCKMIAGAAFIGEHSFSTNQFPTAHNRPDVSDIRNAELFGKKIGKKIKNIFLTEQMADLNIPGFYPYRWNGKLWDVDFIEVDEKVCILCGVCAETCPVGAIERGNNNSIDVGKCITCCSCLKKCPQNARTIKPGPVKEASIRLNNLYKERKEPEIFV